MDTIIRGIDDSIWKDFKHMAIERDKSANAILLELIKKEVLKYRKEIEQKSK